MTVDIQTTPALTLDQLVLGLQGFGLEDNEDIITIPGKNRNVQIKLSNVSPEEERLAHLAVEGEKGYTWMVSIKLDILSRSISWIDGVSIRDLKGSDRLVTDPKDGQRKDIQVVLRSMLAGWGGEVLSILWKLLMVHVQNIEDRLFASFPEAQKMTEVERRHLERAEKEVAAFATSAIQETMEEIFPEEPDAEETK